MTEKKTLTFKLDDPVEHDGTTYSELIFRKMKARDLIAGDGVQGEMRKTFALYASMADVPIEVVEELGLDDFSRMALEVAPLMGKSAEIAAAELKGKTAGADLAVTH